MHVLHSCKKSRTPPSLSSLPRHKLPRSGMKTTISFYNLEFLQEGALCDEEESEESTYNVSSELNSNDDDYSTSYFDAVEEPSSVTTSSGYENISTRKLSPLFGFSSVAFSSASAPSSSSAPPTVAFSQLMSRLALDSLAPSEVFSFSSSSSSNNSTDNEKNSNNSCSYNNSGSNSDNGSEEGRSEVTATEAALKVDLQAYSEWAIGLEDYDVDTDEQLSPGRDLLGGPAPFSTSTATVCGPR